MEKDVEKNINTDVRQDNEENRRYRKTNVQDEVSGRMSSANRGRGNRTATMHGEVPGRMALANYTCHDKNNRRAKGSIVSGTITSSDIERGPSPSDADKSSEAVLEPSSSQCGPHSSNANKSSEVNITLSN
ncbi:uncharacterized protein LOC128223315 [Mya arenaria]|uniref:uncharacterized protein LOC128223315 n=1 Tax=Mya arenaria TaxID=6604 RepID=UPI0022E099E5|nr:uncharacterized protein LOC128223315 [Mya arenaria]